MRILSVLLLLLSTYIIGSHQRTVQYATCFFEEIQGGATINPGAHANIYSIDGTTLTVEFIIDQFANTGKSGDNTYAAQFLTYGYNPTNKTDLGDCFNNDNSLMGCPTTSTTSKSFRAGDIGNIAVTNQASRSIFNLTKPNLLDSPNSVIGRSIGIYQQTYSCEITTQTQASLGSLLTYCTIGIGNLGYSQTTAVNSTDVNTALPWSGLTNVLGIARMNETTTATSDEIDGQVSFVQNGTTTQVRSRLTGLSYLAHGFHIHLYGDLSLQTGDSLGGHWSNATQVHGIPNDQSRHFGDMGNFCLFDQDMMGGYYSFDTDYIKVANLIGRGMAVHKMTDNGSVTSFGARDAQGVIALVATNPVYTGVPVPDWKFTPTCTMASIGVADMSYSQGSNDNMVPSSTSSLLPFFGLIIASFIATLF